MILAADGPCLIDWVDASRGRAAADVARSLVIFRGSLALDARQRERTWVGRGLIAAVTLLALVLVIAGRRSAHNPLGMIVVLGLLAIAFSTQLLPMTVDILYLRRGTRAGAVAGLVAGLGTVFVLSPFWSMLAGELFADVLGTLKRMIDTGAWGLLVNVAVFAAVSRWGGGEARPARL